MKKVFVVFVMILGARGAVFAGSDPCEGFWISYDDKTGKATAGWEIYVENGKLFGRILSLAGFPQDVSADKCNSSYPGFPAAGDVRKMKVVGTSWIYGLSAESTGIWSGGSIIDPKTGSLYKCRIIYHATGAGKSGKETLEMRGEIGLGIGRSQFWQRAGGAEAAALR
ncbi:MAG: DUF2147 domain-containing protein [Spirochaetaceae bacterium]|jgi:uncharacterized protein (DUF2147 family)|nr:DUF2147 domain-containing protein [Spirochaetaceae bacterium]